MNFHSRSAALGVAGLLTLSIAPLPGSAQDGPDALKQQIRRLEDQNRVLREENTTLKSKAYTTSTLLSPASAEPLTPVLNEVPQDDPDYLFLKLGENKDYLKAERWRIIDQIEQAIPPLYEPIRPFHGYTLPPGAFRAGVSATYGHNPGDFGNDKFYALFFDNVKVDFFKLDVDVAYGFEVGKIHDLTLQLNVPYKFQRTRGTGHPFRIAPMVMTMEGAGDGVGDLSLTLKKKWLDQANNSPVTFSTMLGVIFPTGDDEQQFNASQTVLMNGMAIPVNANIPGNPAIDVFGRRSGDLRFPGPGQPGNGAWGGRFGFGITRQFQRSALHGGVVYDLFADNDGVTPGDELKYGVSYTFPPMPTDHLALDLAIFGIWKGDERFPGTIMHPERDPATGGPIMDAAGNLVMFATSRPDFEHGNTLFFGPSLILTPRPSTRITLSPAVRILEPDRGPSPEWMMSGGITYTF